jgi:hypothetical protein
MKSNEDEKRSCSSQYLLFVQHQRVVTVMVSCGDSTAGGRGCSRRESKEP